MDEVSFWVEDDFCESRFAREFAQPLLFGARRGYVGGEAAGVAAARDAAYFGVVARAAVAAGYDYGFSARAAQFLERGGEARVDHYGVAAGALEFPQAEVFADFYVVQAHLFSFLRFCAAAVFSRAAAGFAARRHSWRGAVFSITVPRFTTALVSSSSRLSILTRR